MGILTSGEIDRIREKRKGLSSGTMGPSIQIAWHEGRGTGPSSESSGLNDRHSDLSPGRADPEFVGVWSSEFHDKIASHLLSGKAKCDHESTTRRKREKSENDSASQGVCRGDNSSNGILDFVPTFLFVFSSFRVFVIFLVLSAHHRI